MSRLEAVAVRDAVATLQRDEVLLLPIAVGMRAAERAALLDNVTDLLQAVRALGVDAQVLRLSGQEIDSDLAEHVFVLYAGELPEMPWRAER